MKIKMREYEELKKELNKSVFLKSLTILLNFCYTYKNYQPEVFLQIKVSFDSPFIKINPIF